MVVIKETKEVSMAKLLVWYATHEGQTRKILERIVTHNDGCEVEWCLLEEEPSFPLTQYDRILIGASIRYGHFPKALSRMVKHRAEELTTKDAAFIGVCLTARKPEKREPHTNLYMRKWLMRSPWQPESCAVFAGALRYSRYRWWQRLIIQFIMLLTGGSTDTNRDIEFTDWQQVDCFAKRFFETPAAHIQ
jgi:menaquinone-dependent protoporphyrinogen oxidase